MRALPCSEYRKAERLRLIFVYNDIADRNCEPFVPRVFFHLDVQHPNSWFVVFDCEPYNAFEVHLCDGVERREEQFADLRAEQRVKSDLVKPCQHNVLQALSDRHRVDLATDVVGDRVYLKREIQVHKLALSRFGAKGNVTAVDARHYFRVSS